MGAEAVAAVHHHDALGDPLEVDRPIEGGVAAAHQQHPLVGERLGVEHAIEHPAPVPAVHVFERQLARGERADAAGNQDRVRRILVLVGNQYESRTPVVRFPTQPDHLLGQVNGCVKLDRLLGHAADQVFREHLGEAGDVEDVLFRVERGELAADLVEVVDKAARRPAHAGVECPEQPCRARTDDRDILELLHPGNCNGRGGRRASSSRRPPAGDRFRAVKIYTKTGDGGDTGLLGGGRVRKDDPRVAAYGQVDELCAVIGFALALEPQEFSRDALERIQRDLFTMGAELATPDAAALGRVLPGDPIGESEILALETIIDAREEELAPLTNFILPGGTPKAAALHVARTVCRRAERAVVSARAAAPAFLPRRDVPESPV